MRLSRLSVVYRPVGGAGILTMEWNEMQSHISDLWFVIEMMGTDKSNDWEDEISRLESVISFLESGE